MKFSINDFFGKCDQIRSFPRIWSHLLEKSLMENFTFCAVTKWLGIQMCFHYLLLTANCKFPSMLKCIARLLIAH